MACGIFSFAAKIPRWLLLGSRLGFAAILILTVANLWSQTEGRVNDSQQATPSGASGEIAAQAQRAFRAGDYSQAAKEYQELIKTNPGVAELHSNLAAAYYFSGHFGEAAQESRLALKLKPSLLNAHYFLGISLAQSGYCSAAIPYLEKDFPRVHDVKLRRVTGTDALRCSMALDHVQKAIDYDQILNREFPNDPEILYLTAHIYSDLSTQASQHLLASAPGSYEVHRMNAEVLELQGKPQAAITEYRKVLDINSRVVDIHYEIGKILLQQSHDLETLKKAKAEFEEELQIDPGNAEAEYQLGQIAGTVREWNTAIMHFKRAASLDPQMVPALINLGEAYVAAGQVKHALAPLQRATELDPSNPDAHYRLSSVYRRLGLDREADRQLAAYKQASEKLMKVKQQIRKATVGDAAKAESPAGNH